MTLSGTQLGSYEVIAQIGAGGMGEVYQAHDTKLGRDVAIKVLPEAFAHDPERLSRFQREAKMLAALNHPNIATIYGLEQSNGTSYLVMELVAGETLAQRIKREGALPIEEALAICKQIAEALEAAHEKGIIHRDLKPANVKVTPEGKVKVLDFGLAKAFAGDAANDDPSNSPTLSMAATMHGVILGTAAYMSPEQARGKAVDKRTDIWAFGCVLYELLCGHQAFEGEDVTEILAAVVKTEPDWNRLPEATPPAIRALLRRCLRKDKRQRFHDAADVRIEIDDAIAAPKDSGTTQPAPGPRSKLLLAVAVATTVIAAVALWGWWRATRPVEQAHLTVTRLLMGLQPAESILGGPGTNSQARPTRTAIAWSPDGRTLVFGGDRAGVEQLYVRRLDQLQATPLAGTEGAVSPFFSPDGGWVGFWAAGALKKVSPSGGPAVTICETPLIASATWTEGDVIFFDILTSSQYGGGISRVAAGGGRPEPVAMPSKGEFSLRLPHALPGGKALLLTRLTTNQLADAKIVVWSLATGQQVVLTDGADARYVPTGHLVFVRQGALLAAPFDVTALRLTGGAVGMVDDVMQAFNAPTAPLRTGAAQFDVSPTGSLAYAPGGIFSEDLRSLVWVDRTGNVMPLAFPQVRIGGPGLPRTTCGSPTTHLKAWVVVRGLLIFGAAPPRR